MLGALGIWAGKDIDGATPAVTRGLGLSGLIEGPPHSVVFYHTQGDVEDLFLTWILTGHNLQEHFGFECSWIYPL
jgi:hypothetical protein